ncbi:MAG: adenylyl-sulfate kinase [Streptosporangiaceae bacterium]
MISQCDRPTSSAGEETTPSRDLEAGSSPSSPLSSWSPTPRELGDLELLLAGALAPLRGFLDRRAIETVTSRGLLPDGTPWLAPITLTVPAETAAAASEARRLVLSDPENTPLAVVDITDTWRTDGGGHGVAGEVSGIRAPVHGAFRSLYRSPDEVTKTFSRGPVLGVPLTAPPLKHQLDLIGARAVELSAEVLLLPTVGQGSPQLVSAEALIRAVLAASAELPGRPLVVPVPLAAREPQADRWLRRHLALAYGATSVLDVSDASGVAGMSSSLDDISALLDAGEPLPPGTVSPTVERELRHALPPRYERGVTVFFTGLSGSGKSTIARGLRDALLERGDRTVTLLDGDIVRRLLSKGLTFSREDRETNIRRIGYVAAEISRHGGAALCAPIAPYASTRAEVRRMVEETGGFVLVYVATPLEECERRDRKGLYAKARAGTIKEFTGVSDPYEPPGDADLVLDTTTLQPEEAVARVIDWLVTHGWLRPGSPGGAGRRSAAPRQDGGN